MLLLGPLGLLGALRRRSDDADNADNESLLSFFLKDVKRMMCSKKALVGLTGGFDPGP